MTRYEVILRRPMTFTVVVEAEDPQAAIDAALDTAPQQGIEMEGGYPVLGWLEAVGVWDEIRVVEEDTGTKVWEKETFTRV